MPTRLTHEQQAAQQAAELIVFADGYEEAGEWDRVLRALVWQAWELRGPDLFDHCGSPEYQQACREIVDTHARWPLVQYAIELRYARMVQRQRARWIAESVALMQDTYPVLEKAAA